MFFFNVTFHVRPDYFSFVGTLHDSLLWNSVRILKRFPLFTLLKPRRLLITRLLYDIQRLSVFSYDKGI